MGNIGSDDELDDLAKQIGGSLNIGGEKEGLELVAEWITKGEAKNILVLCGAGVSVSAGIPDFRTPGTGLYDNLQKYNLPAPEAIFDIGFYRENPQAFCTLAKELWPGLTHSPTLTHSFLKLLSDRGILLRNYTQNIDGLDHLAGIPAEKLVECHGHFRSASCIECHAPADGERVKDTIVQKGMTPICEKCGGNVKPDIVFFGEDLPARFHKMLKRDVQKADLMLILGTSLQVAPVSLIPNMVRCPRVLLNRDLVLRLTRNDIFVEGDCDENVLELASVLGWKKELMTQNAKSQIKPKQAERDCDD